ncbi:MAG: hypothetical protein AAF851_22510 [Myxococcota bacterium]
MTLNPLEEMVDEGSNLRVQQLSVRVQNPELGFGTKSSVEDANESTRLFVVLDERLGKEGQTVTLYHCMPPDREIVAGEATEDLDP